MDIKLPSGKDILEKLSVLKSNVPLLISIIITLVAILLFVPTKLMSDRLRARVQQDSVMMGNKISRANAQPVSRNLPEAMDQYLEVYSNDANQITQLAMQTTKRELLSYQIFPSPNDTSMLLFQEFGQRYQVGIEQMLDRVNAGTCPTPEELERGLESLGGAGRRPMTIEFRQRPGRVSARALGLSSHHGLTEAEVTIVDGICTERAKALDVYAVPADLAGYNFWRDYVFSEVTIEDAVKDCWYYQLGYWIIEDVVKTIEAANAGHDSLLDAPVKRLSYLTFTMGSQGAGRTRRGGYFGRRTRSSQDADKPAYVWSEDEALTQSFTGRLSDESTDVVHFSFAVIVDAKEILPFMQQLCSAKEHTFKGWNGQLAEPQLFKHNQITVLESSETSIDPDREEHARYRYGEHTVMELNLICEYIFNRPAYIEIMPETVKNPPVEEQ